MRTLKNALIAAASVGLLAVMSASPAEAALINFTWNPSASSPSLTGLDSIFTTNVLTVGDWAKIDTTGGLGAIQEYAILNVTSLNETNDGTASPLLGNGFGGAGYQLYFQVHAVSSLSGSPLTGSFTLLDYTLYGVVGGGCTFAVNSGGPTATGGGGCATPVDLAHGSLLPGGINSVGITNTNQPFASVDTTIVKDGGAGNFFVSPSDLTFFAFESAFTNTQLVSYYCAVGANIGTAGCVSARDGGVLDINHPIILIAGGGGDVNMFALPVPEPVTLSLFGAGLVGAAALRRRKAKKA
jgi:hypothetical protein